MTGKFHMTKTLMGLVALLLTTSSMAQAAPSAAEFHRKVYQLHEQEIAKRPIKTEQEKGQYEGAAAGSYGYVETRYLDAETGRLISRVRRDAKDPTSIHIAEVNLYDERGRVTRDYGSIALPWSSSTPVRTFINLHHYDGGLHSFRQYDIDGKVGYESCEGTLNGKRERLSVDGSDITAQLTATPLYRACFAGMTQKFSDFVNPH